MGLFYFLSAQLRGGFKMEPNYVLLLLVASLKHSWTEPHLPEAKTPNGNISSSRAFINLDPDPSSMSPSWLVGDKGQWWLFSTIVIGIPYLPCFTDYRLVCLATCHWNVRCYYLFFSSSAFSLMLTADLFTFTLKHGWKVCQIELGSIFEVWINCILTIFLDIEV